jgi:hypothetical protein
MLAHRCGITVDQVQDIVLAHDEIAIELLQCFGQGCGRSIVAAAGCRAENNDALRRSEKRQQIAQSQTRL